jgi:hypothetical protein
MVSSPTVQAARNFLRVVWEGTPPTDAELAEALDRLVVAYHDTPDADVSESDLEAPRQDGASLYREVANRFPDYGIYALADPLEPIDQQMSAGDAIDDLADITLDMREVVWLAEHVGLEDAHWSFRLHFFHWGQHARELSLYLHARQ